MYGTHGASIIISNLLESIENPVLKDKLRKNSAQFCDHLTLMLEREQAALQGDKHGANPTYSLVIRENSASTESDWFLVPDNAICSRDIGPFDSTLEAKNYAKDNNITISNFN